MYCFVFSFRYLADNFHYIDGSRIGMWGWSYGGYVTTMALAKDNDNSLKCGIAVAPVSNWLLYGKE